LPQPLDSLTRGADVNAPEAAQGQQIALVAGGDEIGLAGYAQIRIENKPHRRHRSGVLPGAPFLPRRCNLRLDLFLGNLRQLQRIQPGQPLGEPLRGSFFRRSIN
jgi:hypothetical protein